MKEKLSFNIESAVWPAVGLLCVGFLAYAGWNVFQAMGTAEVSVEQTAAKAMAVPSLITNVGHTRFGTVTSPVPEGAGRIDPFQPQ